MIGSVKSALSVRTVQRPAALTRDPAARQNPTVGSTRTSDARGAAATNNSVEASGTARGRDATLFGGSTQAYDAHASEMEHVLATLASARIDGRKSAAQALQEAERKLIRLRMQVRAALESGNRNEAAYLAAELAAVDQDIAAAARDYAAAASAPGDVTEAASGSSDGGNAGGLAQEAVAAAAEVSQAAAAPTSTDEPDRAQTNSTADGTRTTDGAEPAPSGSTEGVSSRAVQAERDARRDAEFLDAAHRLLEESRDLFRAMKRLAETPAARETPGQRKG